MMFRFLNDRVVPLDGIREREAVMLANSGFIQCFFHIPCKVS